MLRLTADAAQDSRRDRCKRRGKPAVAGQRRQAGRRGGLGDSLRPALQLDLVGDLFLGLAGGVHEDPFDAVLLIELQRSEEHTSELQSRQYLVCRLLLEK